MKTLDEIMTRNGSDKGSLLHCYTDTYQRYFDPIKNEPLTILEIGVQFGNSLRSWAEYFPNAKIVGMDVVSNGVSFQNPRINFLIGDASSPGGIERLKSLGPFDIIIDDGSHFNNEVIDSYTGLFGSLRPGGIYCIEDIHASYHPAFRRTNALTITNFLKCEIDILNESGAGMNGKPSSDAKMSFIHFYKSLCIIGKPL